MKSAKTQDECAEFVDKQTARLDILVLRRIILVAFVHLNLFGVTTTQTGR